MREHLEYSGATDIDDLIEAIHDINQRMDRLQDARNATDDDIHTVSMRSWRRLDKKRDDLLAALNDALSYLRT